MSPNTDPVDVLQNSLSPELWEVVRLAGEICSKQGHSLYLVGGRVRDLLMERESGDLDLAVEGDALAVAQGLAEADGGRVVTHDRFGTATYTKDDISVDLTTARWEEYSRPGILPLVRPGSIDTDMARRDFTVNAIALQLSPPEAGRILDPYDGRGDLNEGLIRVLHDASFTDDPTRIMRAIRYEQRLAFRLDPKTELFLRSALPSIGSVGVDRNRHELELVLREEQPELALIRAGELGVLERLDGVLKADGWLAERYREARETGGRPPIVVYLSILLYRCSNEDSLRFLHTYRFTKEQVQGVADAMTLKSRRQELEMLDLKRSRLADVLDKVSEDALTAFRVASGSPLVAERIALYLAELRGIAPRLNGRDLQDLGVPRGPELGKMLKGLRRARLDGEAATREDEVALVKKLVG